MHNRRRASHSTPTEAHLSTGDWAFFNDNFLWITRAITLLTGTGTTRWITWGTTYTHI